jgi:hypothetical protein
LQNDIYLVAKINKISVLRGVGEEKLENIVLFIKTNIALAHPTNPVDGEEPPYFSFTHASSIRK